ncbi:MAG TPA: hypothetical protein VD902_10775, partial [Symbiobacteriaceae bacterium]|nr:hypothetical protein [Symbiobacteriaceae bacterium]
MKLTPTLFVTKYTLPPKRPREIHRHRLTEQLLTNLNRKLTLISAPAGFGKSTLAADLARRAGRPAAWVSLDHTDNDPMRWGAYLLAAIRQAGIPVSGQLQSLLRLEGQTSLETLVATLINEVATAAFPLLLVLDDYHLIVANEIHEAVALLLDRLSPGFHVVITTRTRPQLPLARLRARGDLTEITAASLRFQPEEAEAFLRSSMGLNLPEAGVADLVSRTEGWVTGLQLAALSLHGAADPAAAMRAFNGGSPDLLDYLVDEVIHHQPEAVQTFLLQTAVLDRLTGPLCDALTGQTDGHRTLQALEQSNLFLFPLDQHRCWYRYHPLFAEFLLARLRDQSGEATVAELHRRAARWYRENAQLTEAVDHLLAAGALEQAADWIEEGLADGGSTLPVRRWIEHLPKQFFRQRPRLATMAAWSLIAGRDVQADQYFTQASAYLQMAARALKGAGTVQPEAGVLAAVRTALAPWAPLRQCPMCTLQDTAQAVQCAEEARRLLPEDSLFWRSVVANSLGSVYLRAGNISGAAQAFGEAARLGIRSGNLTAAVAALHRHAHLLTMLGQLNQAGQTYREALCLAAQQGGEALPALAPVYLGLGRLRLHENQLSEAARHIAEAQIRYEAGGNAAAEALLAMARVHQAMGDHVQARQLVDRAGDLLAARTTLRAADAPAWPDGVRVLLDQGDVAGARRWIRTAGVEPDDEPD